MSGQLYHKPESWDFDAAGSPRMTNIERNAVPSSMSLPSCSSDARLIPQRSVTLLQRCSKCRKSMIGRNSGTKALCKTCSIKQQNEAALARQEITKEQVAAGKVRRRPLFSKINQSVARVERACKATGNKEVPAGNTVRSTSSPTLLGEKQHLVPVPTDFACDLGLSKTLALVSNSLPGHEEAVHSLLMEKSGCGYPSPVTRGPSSPVCVEDELHPVFCHSEKTLTGFLHGRHSIMASSSHTSRDEGENEIKRKLIEARQGRSGQYQVLLNRDMALERQRKLHSSHQLKDPSGREGIIVPDSYEEEEGQNGNAWDAARKLFGLPEVRPALVKGEYVLAEVMPGAGTRTRRKAVRKAVKII
ncbi:MAG: hypothetical protein M1818_008340 [Claussenomyces sp. TS43310]|nr:MAG: hypothetical protein M1818_008340 [Claussenomyces sp. TS43310]